MSLASNITDAGSLTSANRINTSSLINEIFVPLSPSGLIETISSFEALSLTVAQFEDNSETVSAFEAGLTQAAIEDQV